MDSENQDMDRRAKTTVTGLVFCAIDPTEIDRGRRYDPTPDAGLWVDSGEGPADEAKAKLPEVPAGCFLQWFFVKEWNRFIHVCGKHAELTWTEDAPVAARATTRALFPGETIDLP